MIEKDDSFDQKSDNDIEKDFKESEININNLIKNNTKSKKIKFNPEKIYNDTNLILLENDVENDKFFLNIQDINEIPKIIKYKPYLIKIYLILCIQFGLILLGSYLGFYFNLNKFFTQDTKSILYTLIPTSIIIYSMCFSAFVITNFYKKPTLLHIYHILYIFCLILLIFLLEKYIEKKYILSSVLIIVIIYFP